MAKDYYSVYPRNELQRKIETFESLNWRMPKDLLELERQIRKISKNNGIKNWNIIIGLENTGPKRLKRILRSKDSYYFFMQDSCFFVNTRWKLGCVLHESHCSLINIDPWHHAFRADFIDAKGRNLMKWDIGEEFYSLVEDISNEYAFKYKCTRDYERMKEEFASVSPIIVNGNLLYKETLYRQVLSFSKDEPYRLYCQGERPDSVWVEDNHGQRFKYIDPEISCCDYFQRIDSIAQSYFQKTKNCQTILCPAPCVFAKVTL